MKTSKTLAFSLALASPVLTVIPASASVSSWSTPASVSSGALPSNSGIQIASFNGLATAVWVQSDGTRTRIQSSRSLDGAAWSTPPNVLSAADQHATFPQVVVDSNGRAIAIWQRSNGTHTIIQSSTSLNGADWSTPSNLSTPGENAERPQVAVDSNGLATAVWASSDSSDGTGNIVRIRSSTSLNGADWSTPKSVSLLPALEAATPQVAVAPNGLATLVWRQRFTQFNDKIMSSTSLNGADWSTPRVVIDPGQSNNPQLAVAPNGLATVVWTRAGGLVSSSKSLNGALWSDPVDLNTGGESVENAQLEVDSNGLVTAIWSQSSVLRSSTSLNGAAWSGTLAVSPAGEESLQAQLTVNSSNLVTVVWRGPESSIINRLVIKSSTSLNGAPWSTPLALFPSTGTDAGRPQVTVDSTGLVTAVWQRGVIQSSFIRQTLAGSTPGTPGTPTATAGNGQATVQITAPTSGGSPASYIVTASPGGATCSITAPATSCTVTGLTNGTSYTFASTATNAGGTSAASASSNSVTPSAPAAGGSSVIFRSVSFDANGGVGSGVAVSHAGGTPIPGNAFTRAGHVFTGWNTKQDGSGVTYTNAGTYAFNSDVTLFAQWVPVKAAVKANRYISNFAGDRAALSPRMRATIDGWVRTLPRNAAITCQGSTSGSRVTAFDRRLAQNRAKNVCNEAVRIRSDLKFSIKLNPSSTNKASARHVLLIQN